MVRKDSKTVENTNKNTLICQQNEDGKFGFVNAQGKEVIPFIYSKVSQFRDGYEGRKQS